MLFPRSVCAVCLLVVLLGCGAEKPKSVTVSITPASATMAAGDVLPLKGNSTGFTDTPSVGWYVEETTRDNNNYCGTDYDERPPDTGSCPCGYVMFNKSDTGTPSTAYYHAPAVPGTCHIRFWAIQMYNYEIQAFQDVVAEVTVTP